MNKILKFKSIASLFVLSAFIFSCSTDSNDDIMNPGIGDGPDVPVNAELIVTESGVGDKRTVDVTGGAMGENIKVNIKFSTTTESMRRLYITQDVGGSGEVPYAISTTGVTVDDKKDGSLDLSNANKNDFDFLIDFPAPNSMANGTIVYRIWATTGRGDFRDTTKRNVFEDNAIGTITVTFGTGTNIANGINTYQATILSAPLGDGSSTTFISVFNGETYKISEGEENAALWDFGYYFLNSVGASLASTSNYPRLFDHDGDSGSVDPPATPLEAVSVLTGVAQEELNKFYMADSSLDFDAINSASDLDGIAQPTTERVNGLTMGDVIEFVDQYGNKGVIQVVDIVTGTGTNGKITINIKVQN